jgi:hypothetical protein
MANVVSQKRWLRGLNVAVDEFSQPQGTLPRVSNLLFTRRGSLKTCDGTLPISLRDSVYKAPAALVGPWTELFLYSPAGVTRSYYGIDKDVNTHLAAPTLLAAVDGGAGLMGAGTYKHVVTALDGAGGETTVSNETTIVQAANRQINLTWTASTNATGYNVYRTLAGGIAGSEKLVASNVTTTAYTDNTPDAGLGTQVPPSTNNTQTCVFYQIPGTSYGAANIIKVLPADLIASEDGTPGGGGGGGGGGSGGGGVTPAGGVAGNVSPLPQIVQFTNKMILALGNGLKPKISDGTIAGTVDITNTFTASYPVWQAATVYAVGDVLSSGGNVFTATQGGTSGAGAPAFPATLGATVADKQVIWKNTGQVSSSPAPRGAAHACVHLGSLWVFNTSPTTTSDNIDGPSCLRMSDLNNGISWNPLNVAFIARDDGSQGMGLVSFAIADTGIAPQAVLVCFKEFATYIVRGVFGASDFSIAQAQTDMGCLASRSIQFVPGFGVIRLTHLGFALFDGVRDRIISEEIRPFIFGGIDDITAVDWNYMYFSKGAQVADPPMYVCACPIIGNNGALTRIFCYDLVLKCWTIVDLPTEMSISVMKQVRAQGTIPITIMGGFSDGVVRRWQMDDLLWDNGANTNLSTGQIAWNKRTPEIFGAGGTAKIYYRRLSIRGRIGDGSTLTITPNYNGTDASPIAGENYLLGTGSSQFDCRVDLNENAEQAHATIAGSGQCQIDSVDWEIVPKPSGVPITIG